MNRKHLANMRVVQKNLVYVIGLSPKIANEEVVDGQINKYRFSLNIFIEFQILTL